MTEPIKRETLRWTADHGGQHRVVVEVAQQITIRKQSRQPSSEEWETDWAHHSYGDFQTSYER